jgi:hypothetical protein
MLSSASDSSAEQPSQSIADDDKLGGLRSRRDLPQKLDEIVLE